ncbi:MAG: hypothetical protein AABY22_11300 [Nanoarchaeota archaeon]|mgnify:CR=1 FL=1
MINGEERVINPHQRLGEVKSKLEPLEKQEEELKNMIGKSIAIKKNKPLLSEVETEIMFLVFEKNILENCVRWFDIYLSGFNKAKEMLK